MAFINNVSVVSHAQEALGLDPTGRSGDRRLEPLEEQPLPPPPPKIVVPPSAPERKAKGMPLTRAFVRRINVIGSTVYSAEELARVTAPYENRELTGEDLEALRRAVTLLYVDKGYINSGAIIPDQLVDGVITVQVIEGELTDMNIGSLRWFRTGYISDRIGLGAGPPLNIISLQERLQLIQQDPLIQRINAELKPGVRRGESILNVQVEENNPYQLSFIFDNYQSPSVGAERGQVTASHQNLTGNRDTLSLTYGRSEGVECQIDAWYSLPFTSRDTSVAMRFRKNDFSVIEEPFEPLDIESESEIYEITLRHPFYRTISHEFALALAGEYLYNKTYLLGEPFSFALGVEDGESSVAALRFSQEWTYRTQAQVIAARSRFSLGVDALGATTNDSSIPDGQFFSWLGQFQWARILGLWDIQTILRTDVQLTDDPLLPLEQFAVGGRYTVRGYRENQMVRDNGLVASLEFRIPLIQEKSWADYLHLAPFVDYGTAWNESTSFSDAEDITSAGLGLRWAATLPPPLRLRPQFEIYWGVPFEDIETDDWDLQDEGIHMQVIISTAW
jgi:hemolysin activation/secretion protein